MSLLLNMEEDSDFIGNLNDLLVVAHRIALRQRDAYRNPFLGENEEGHVWKTEDDLKSEDNPGSKLNELGNEYIVRLDRLIKSICDDDFFWSIAFYGPDGAIVKGIIVVRAGENFKPLEIEYKSVDSFYLSDFASFALRHWSETESKSIPRFVSFHRYTCEENFRRDKENFDMTDFGLCVLEAPEPRIVLSEEGRSLWKKFFKERLDIELGEANSEKQAIQVIRNHVEVVKSGFPLLDQTGEEVSHEFHTYAFPLFSPSLPSYIEKPHIESAGLPVLYIAARKRLTAGLNVALQLAQTLAPIAMRRRQIIASEFSIDKREDDFGHEVRGCVEMIENALPKYGSVKAWLGEEEAKQLITDKREVVSNRELLQGALDYIDFWATPDSGRNTLSDILSHGVLNESVIEELFYRGAVIALARQGKGIPSKELVTNREIVPSFKEGITVNIESPYLELDTEEEENMLIVRVILAVFHNTVGHSIPGGKYEGQNLYPICIYIDETTDCIRFQILNYSDNISDGDNQNDSGKNNVYGTKKVISGLLTRLEGELICFDFPADQSNVGHIMEKSGVEVEKRNRNIYKTSFVLPLDLFA